MRLLSPVLILIVAVAFQPIFAAAPLLDGEAQFHQLVDEYFAEFFRHCPTEATAAGLHEFDNRLEDYSHAGWASRIVMLKRYLSQFDAIAPRTLRPDSAADRELVISNIRGQLHQLEEFRAWQKNPDIYASGPNRSIFLLTERKFAPSSERLKSVTHRLRQISVALDAARANLDNPPRIYTTVALERMPAIIRYFEKDLPLAFTDVKSQELLKEFEVTNQSVVEGLNKYQQFLRDELLPRSHGDFCIGAENFRKMLLYEEMIDIPLSRLLQIGYEDLRRNQKQFQQTAARIDPGRTPRQVLVTLTQDHPTRETLLGEVRNGLDDLRGFILTHKILTLPTLDQPLVWETPAYKRARSWASVETPGPFETKSNEAYYFVTLPEPTWSLQQIREHLESYSRPELANLSIHEAYPGHYTQYLWIHRAPSKVRRLVGCESYTEGWAHYAEQMMLDEGYADNDPKLRLVQLHDALLRNARCITSLQMHTNQMSYEEAVEFFMEEGYQTRSAAEVEAKRGTVEPQYVVYTLGKLAILKLRNDYKKLRGDKFRLQDFHDEFLETRLSAHQTDPAGDGGR